MDKWKVGGLLMIAMVTNAQRYDWSTWLMGILRSLIQGGAAAVVAGFSVNVIAPNTFNFADGLGRTLELMVTMFIIQGVIHMMMFLQVHGAPELITTKYVETDSTVTHDGAGATSHISTVETVTTKPVIPKP